MAGMRQPGKSKQRCGEKTREKGKGSMVRGGMEWAWGGGGGGGGGGGVGGLWVGDGEHGPLGSRESAWLRPVMTAVREKTAFPSASPISH